MTVYDLPPGQAICPYHFHWGDEDLAAASGACLLRAEVDRRNCTGCVVAGVSSMGRR